MAKILEINDSKSRGRMLISIENGGEILKLNVTCASLSELDSPRVLSEISVYDAASLIFDDECFRAMKRAVTVLAASDKSERRLYEKLMSSGFSREAVIETVNEVKRRGYLDEDRQLSRLVEREANLSLRGRQYIIRKLLTKGYKTSDIVRAIDALTFDGTIDFDRNFEILAEMKGAADEESRALLKHKFGYSRY